MRNVTIFSNKSFRQNISVETFRCFRIWGNNNSRCKLCPFDNKKPIWIRK